MAGAVGYQPGIPAGMTQTSVADCIINVSYDGSNNVEYKGIALSGRVMMCLYRH